MDGFIKTISAGTLASLIAYVAEWTKILHRDYLVHPDWQDSVDGDSMVWSIPAVFILYILIYKLNKSEIRVIVFVFFALCLGLLAVCIYFSNIIPSLPKVETANNYIHIWRWFFMAADVAIVCAGMSFGLWLVARDGTANPP